MKIAVTLYFWGDFLIPADITEALKISPSESQTKGEVTTTFAQKKAVAKTGMWAFSSDYSFQSENLKDHISFLRKKIGDNAAQLTTLKNVQHARVDVFMATTSGTECEFELSQDNLVELNDIGLPIRFTVAFVQNNS